MFNRKEYSKIMSEIPSYVKILAASKTKPAEDIILAVNSGIKIIGENYVQEAEEKYEKLKDLFKKKKISFHLIGHLQSNKAGKAAEIFDCIETIDSEELAKKLDQHCQKLNKKIDVMIEVNFNESQKSGIKISGIDSLIREIGSLDNLNLVGFMCIPLIGKEEEYYIQMKMLKQKYNIPQLSMGMSSDYKKAISHGTTIIRLGTILFGKRD